LLVAARHHGDPEKEFEEQLDRFEEKPRRAPRTVKDTEPFVGSVLAKPVAAAPEDDKEGDGGAEREENDRGAGKYGDADPFVGAALDCHVGFEVRFDRFVWVRRFDRDTLPRFHREPGHKGVEENDDHHRVANDQG
jgi:hypothetical protein